MAKDWCTSFPEHWVSWRFSWKPWKVIYIGDCCKKHDNVDDENGGCATHDFIECLMTQHVVGAIFIALGASIACWVKYPFKMIRRV